MGRFSTQQMAPEDMPSAVRVERDRLKGRVTELETALKRYGQHDDDCRTVNANVPESSCNCGLMNALKRDKE